MSTLIKKLPANTVGKDYVVGDLHGCYDLLERLLLTVSFDKERDRLFSVGDLVDRGPDSLRCLALLNEPWFYSVMGNHEEMMLDFFLPYLETGILQNLQDLNGADFLINGGEWIREYYLPKQQRMTDAFNQCLGYLLGLPLILVIGEGDQRFHVLHAELVKPDHNNDIETVWLDSDIDEWLRAEKLPDKMPERLLWSRTMFYNGRFNKVGYASHQPGLSTTFCGHTPTITPYRILSHLCIDTGSFFTLPAFGGDDRYGLTLFDVQASCRFQSSYLRDEVLRVEFES